MTILLMAFFKIFMSLQAFRTRIHILTALADFPIQVLLKMFGFFLPFFGAKAFEFQNTDFCVFLKIILEIDQ